MIGIDLVSMPPFARLLRGVYGKKMMSLMFTEREILECKQGTREPDMHDLAERFAVKEAAIKASESRLGLRDLPTLETRHTPRGVLVEVVGGSPPTTFRCSSCHGDDYAVGVAIAADERPQ